MAIRNVSVLVLYNERGEILLQHRSKNAKRLPDHWAFFGGGIEEGEKPKQTLRREILEELEYSVHNPKLVFVQKFTWKGDKNTKYVFVDNFDAAQSLVQHEGQGMRWWKFEDLKDLLIVEHDKEALAKVEEHLKLNAR